MRAGGSHTFFNCTKPLKKIVWSGYAVTWVHDDFFTRLTPYFPTFVEAYEAAKNRRFQTEPAFRSDQKLIKTKPRTYPLMRDKRAHQRGDFHRHDLTDQRFGKLVVNQVAGRLRSGHTLWLCTCDCGDQVNVRITDLTTGRKISCGCVPKRLNRPVPIASEEMRV